MISGNRYTRAKSVRATMRLGPTFRVSCFVGAGLAAALLPAGTVHARGGAITFDAPAAQAASTVTVTSSAFKPRGAIPLRHSAYDDNISPPLSWNGAPAGTISFALIVEDPDAAPREPVVHWVVWNLPKATNSLPEGVEPTKPGAPADIMQGANSHGGTGYYGPHPPRDDPPHRYFFQVFALDRTIALAEGSALEAVRHAMAGHILAKGEVFGTFARPANPKHP